MESEVLLRILADGSGRVIGGGQEPTGRGFIGRVNQDANALHLQVRTQPSGIVCHHGCSQPMTLQQADDQFRLHAAANDRQHPRAVHGLHPLLPP